MVSELVGNRDTECDFNETDNLSALKEQIAWCLSQFISESGEADGKDQEFMPNWSVFRTLQNNLYKFLNYPDSEQAVAVSALLITILNNVFSDLCTDTPWDKEKLINSARQQAHAALITILKDFYGAIEESNADTDNKLWRAYQSFEFKYSNILLQINNEDIKRIQSLVSGLQ